ncbi:MAG: nitrophenyl compound nitroreductase subunit ArsF family protein [Pseudomonadota bacterium]
MPLKSVIRIVLLIFVVGSVTFLIAKEYGFDTFRSAEAPPSSVTKVAAERFVLFYFHGYRRCFTCRAIEKYLAEEAKADFAGGLASGAFEWRPVNVEEPENRHFIKDFGLVSSTAVIAEMRSDEVERSKKLDLVWRLVRDEPAFKEYVKNEVLNFINGGRQR